MLGKNLKMLASSNDGVVEYFKHINKLIYGIMWHPERNKKIKKFDREIIKKYLNEFSNLSIRNGYQLNKKSPNVF